VGNASVWKVLDGMIADFRRRGADVPSETVNDLRTAKTILKIMEANVECGQNLQEVEHYLGRVQVYLVSEGQKRFGQEYVDSWIAKIDEASRKMPDREENEERFVPGLPRQQSWIRITASAELPLEEAKKLANDSGLFCVEQTENVLLVHGEKEKVKDLVKKIAKKHKP
jgi:hypothetical protein